MATITLQLYLTDTLTAITGVSLAVWNSGNTAVVDSGVTDGNGQLDVTLSTSTTYNIKGFLDGYSITDASITTGLVDATFNVYGDVVPYGAKVYSDYKDEIVNNLRGRNDAKTLALIMTNFNNVQEFLSKDIQWEDLFTIASGSLTDTDDTYSYADLGLTTLNEILSIRINDGTSWGRPLTYYSPIDWDTLIEPIEPVEDNLPYCYTRMDGNIILYPPPDDTYAYKIPATLFATPVTGDSSVVDFSNIDSILVNLTTAFTWLSLGENELAESFFKITDKFLTPYTQTDIRKRYASSQRHTKLDAFL